jgi:arylsulfatase
VLPLDDRTGELFGGRAKPYSPHGRTKYVFHPPVSHINADAAPAIGSRSFKITAEIERPDEKANGVLAAYGVTTSGLSFYIQDGFLTFDYNLYQNHYRVVSSEPIPVGASHMAVRFDHIDQRAKATLIINEKECGSIDIPRVMRMISAQGMDIGRDGGSPITDDYKAPFPFSGIIRRIIIDVPKRIPPKQQQEIRETEAKSEMSRQ